MSGKESPEELLIEIKMISGQIAKILQSYETSKQKTYDKAIGLQRLQKKRAELMGKLPKFTLIEHPNPETLEPFFKRTRAEVRKFMGLDYIEGSENEYL